MDMQAFLDSTPTVGQKVFVARYSQPKRRYVEGEESVVTKVGRKYFEVEGVAHKFFIDTKHCNSEYSAAPTLYPSKECFELESWVSSVKSAIRIKMNSNNALDSLNASELKTISDILIAKCDLKI